MFDLAVLAAEAGVRLGVINLAGLAVGLGGIVLTALWLRSLYR